MYPIENYLGFHWQMANCEKFAIEGLLRKLSPDVAFEVGTYQGGSLQVLSKFSKDVVSIDIDPDVKERLSGKLSNVIFHTGDSSNLLPTLLEQYALNGRCVNFILIDGDHTFEGVRNDVGALLNWVPQSKCIVLIHDSFNPSCREGIRTAGWVNSPYVHAVDLDFVPGIYHEYAYDTASARTMWGGFACAVLQPFPRKGGLEVMCSQQGLFNAVYKMSSHADSRALIARIARKFMAVWR